MRWRGLLQPRPRCLVRREGVRRQARPHPPLPLPADGARVAPIQPGPTNRGAWPHRSPVQEVRDGHRVSGRPGGRAGGESSLMGRKPQRPCSKSGCSALTRSRFCGKHEQAHARATEVRRPSAARRGYGRRWQRLRAIIIARDPVCTCTGRPGCPHGGARCILPTTDVDHIIPREQGGEDSEENLQGMCHGCHSRKTAQEDGGWGRQPTGR